jgi:hypothetical protein
LNATVISGAFSGKGSAWINRHSVQETFVQRLRAFPLSATDPPTIDAWTWASKVTDQRPLFIVILPHGGLRRPLVQVELTSDSRTAEDRDRLQSLTARFVTEYAALDTFAHDLGQVLNGGRDAAVLTGTVG